MRLVAGLAGLLLLGTCGGSQPAPSASGGASLSVSSPDFSGVIPKAFTCDGAGTAPRIAWSGSGKAFVLEVLDPDAPGGTFTHWLVYDIPGSRLHVPPAPAEGRNSAGHTGWTPPCPPFGRHHYHFTVLALGSSPDLPTGLTRDQVESRVSGQVTGRGELIATYSRGQ